MFPQTAVAQRVKGKESRLNVPTDSGSSKGGREGWGWWVPTNSGNSKGKRAKKDSQCPQTAAAHEFGMRQLRVFLCASPIQTAAAEGVFGVPAQVALDISVVSPQQSQQLSF